MRIDAPGRVLAIVASATLVAGCATTPRSAWKLRLPEDAAPSAEAGRPAQSYPLAASSIVSVMERNLSLAVPPLTLTFFPNRGAFEQGLLAVGYAPAFARRTAATMDGIGGHRGVLLNEQALDAMPWPNRLSFLAHELAHVVQYEWSGGQRGLSDQWLREGFAEWVSIEVLGALRVGATPDAIWSSLERQVREAARNRPLPPLAELATFPQWVDAVGLYGHSATYQYAALGARRLVARGGVGPVAEYFRLFAVSPDRRGNFARAFGLSLDAFERELRR